MSGRRGWTSVIVVIAVLGVVAVATRPTPPTFAAVRAAYRPSDTALLDRDGAILQVLRTDARVRRFDWVGLDAISPALVRSVIAAEDRRFDAHGGVDLRALAAAALARLRGAPPRGASTIAMQLAALVAPTLAARDGRRTLAQKWRQMRLARALVRRWTRDEILEAYLNLVPFRGEVVGIGAAAALLTGKAPHGLTDVDAIALAALVRAPNAPVSRVVARARALAATVAADVPAAQVESAARTIAAATAIAPARLALAPHLARRLLTGATAPVRTTLARDTQRVAVAALRHNLLDLEGRHVGDGAVLVVDNASGDVLAYAAASAASSRARFVDTVRARRQPGSTLKPFLYGVALERRVLTPASLLEDTPLEIALPGGIYRPRDYDQQFRGVVTLRTALAASLNVPAVRTLGLVGGDAVIDRLRALGLDGVVETADYYGPALALGAADVSLWELVGAYRALARGGMWTPLHVTAAPASEPVRVFDEATAFLIGDILADREARSTTFGLESTLATPFWTAVKTGTSKDMRDNWCVGWSRRYTVGVWVGNASGDAMHDVSGVAGAAPVWLEVMTSLHRSTPSAAPATPPGIVAAPVSFADAVEPPRREWFLAGTEPRGAQRTATAEARIVTPVAGAIVVLDPDMPPAQQRVALEASAGTGARWRVDDADVGPVNGLTLWKPTRGTHVVTLVDERGRALDAVGIEVRG